MLAVWGATDTRELREGHTDSASVRGRFDPLYADLRSSLI
jgi:hypothetical protein